MRQFLKAAAFVLMTTTAMAAPAKQTAPVWVTSWATSQLLAEGNWVLAPADMTDTTLRQVVRLSIGGEAYRLTLSNAFGTEALHLKSVHVARSTGGDGIDPQSDREVAKDIVIPAGASWVSEPVDMKVAPLADMAISIHYDTAPKAQTSHPGSRQWSYIVGGDHTADATLPGAKAVDHWYNIASIEVATTKAASALVALGDSITDGKGSTTNGNDRWTNFLAAQFAAHAKKPIGVLNAGIGGNCVLAQCLGPNALSRLEHDVFAHPGVTSLIVFEGVNDLGRISVKAPVLPEVHAETVARLIEGYRQIATRARAHGLKIYIGTILPYAGSEYYHADAANEADRLAVNAWIRSQKIFDGVIDFDAALKDPARPNYLLPVYDCGDGIHPSPAAFKLMGEMAAKVVLGETALKAKAKP